MMRVLRLNKLGLKVTSIDPNAPTFNAQISNNATDVDMDFIKALEVKVHDDDALIVIDEDTNDGGKHGNGTLLKFHFVGGKAIEEATADLYLIQEKGTYSDKKHAACNDDTICRLQQYAS